MLAAVLVTAAVLVAFSLFFAGMFQFDRLFKVCAILLGAIGVGILVGALYEIWVIALCSEGYLTCK